MHLKEYFKKKKINIKDFAKEAGLSKVTIYNIMGRKTMPRLSTALKIESLTNKKVTVKDLLDGFETKNHKEE